jgi:hypothetical protein
MIGEEFMRMRPYYKCHALGIGAGALRRLCRLQHKATDDCVKPGPLCECVRYTTVHRSWVDCR